MGRPTGTRCPPTWPQAPRLRCPPHSCEGGPVSGSPAVAASRPLLHTSGCVGPHQPVTAAPSQPAIPLLLSWPCRTHPAAERARPSAVPLGLPPAGRHRHRQEPFAKRSISEAEWPSALFPPSSAPGSLPDPLWAPAFYTSRRTGITANDAVSWVGSRSCRTTRYRVSKALCSWVSQDRYQPPPLPLPPESPMA